MRVVITPFGIVTNLTEWSLGFGIGAGDGARRDRVNNLVGHDWMLF
jgi:hypothetical protein